MCGQDAKEFLGKWVIQKLRGQEEGVGVSRKSMLGHVTKGRYHVKYPQLSTRGGEGVKIGQNLVHVVIE